MDDKAQVFRFKHGVVKSHYLKGVEFRAPDGPIGIFNSSSQLLGFATLENFKDWVSFSCAITSQCDERLNLEVPDATPYWLDVQVETRFFISGNQQVPSVAAVKRLMLTMARIPDQAPINGCQGVLE